MISIDRAAFVIYSEILVESYSQLVEQEIVLVKNLVDKVGACKRPSMSRAWNNV